MGRSLLDSDRPALAWVYCTKCEQHHPLHPGVGKPWYWCEGEAIALDKDKEVTYLSEGVE